jgi:hypothetical protein
VGKGQGQGAVVSARLLGRACKACMQGLPFVQGAVVSARTRALVSSSLRSVEVLAFPGARDGARARNTSASSSSSSAAASSSAAFASSASSSAASSAAKGEKPAFGLCDHSCVHAPHRLTSGAWYAACTKLHNALSAACSPSHCSLSTRV